MRALPRSRGNGIPASRQAGRSATGHRSEFPRCYSRTGRARCARSTRSRPAANNSGVRDEAIDAARSVNANAYFAMGGTDVTEETRRCVATDCAYADGVHRLAMKPVVLAREHRVTDQNFRRLRKGNDCAEHDEWHSGTDPASFSKSRSREAAQPGNPIDITQRERNDRAAQQAT